MPRPRRACRRSRFRAFQQSGNGRARNALARAAVVQQLGYVPNRLAGGLSSAKSRLIAAIVPTIAHSFSRRPMQVFSDTMSRPAIRCCWPVGLQRRRRRQLLDAVLSRRPGRCAAHGRRACGILRERLLQRRHSDCRDVGHDGQPIDMLVGFSHYRVGAAVADASRARRAASGARSPPRRPRDRAHYRFSRAPRE